jgi:hypothetical protein
MRPRAAPQEEEMEDDDRSVKALVVFGTSLLGAVACIIGVAAALGS